MNIINHAIAICLTFGLCFPVPSNVQNVHHTPKPTSLFKPSPIIKPIEVVLPAPVATLEEIPVAAPQLAPVAPSVVSGCGDNSMANYIYSHESGCSLTSVNTSSGTYGIGQSAGGLSAACPDWQTDYACQNQFFTGYANSRYGGWAGAYQFWLQNHWW